MPHNPSSFIPFGCGQRPRYVLRGSNLGTVAVRSVEKRIEKGRRMNVSRKCLIHAVECRKSLAQNILRM